MLPVNLGQSSLVFRELNIGKHNIYLLFIFINWTELIRKTDGVEDLQINPGELKEKKIDFQES